MATTKSGIKPTSGSTAVWTLPNTVTNGVLRSDVTGMITSVAKRVVSMADATSFMPTADTADVNTHTNTQAVGTLTAHAPSGTPTDGQLLMLRIKTANVQTYAWNAIYRGTTLALRTVSLGANQTEYLGFIYHETDTKWDHIAYA